MMYPALLLLMRTPRLPVVDSSDAPADLNGLVRFAEKRYLVSARGQSTSFLPISLRGLDRVNHLLPLRKVNIFSFAKGGPNIS
jgi:hypothetical protein